MRVGNRISSIITGARMNRIAKNKVWNSSQRRSAGLGTGGTSKSKGVVSKSNNLLLQYLNSMNQGSAMTGERLAKIQSQSYDYDIMRLASDRVKAHMEKLTAEEGASVYDGEDTQAVMDALTKEVSGFVEDYNMVLRKLNESGSNTDEAYAKKLKSQVFGYQASLKQLGITADSKGILSIDRKVFGQAEIAEIKRIFGAKDGFSGKMENLAKEVDSYARKQIEDLKKELCTASTSYNRYGTSGSADSTGSRYSAKG